MLYVELFPDKVFHTTIFRLCKNHLRCLDSQEDLLLENQTLLDNINIITLVDMNDDKHNDVWVSCFHGNSTGLGMVSHRVLFLGQ